MFPLRPSAREISSAEQLTGHSKPIRKTTQVRCGATTAVLSPVQQQYWISISTCTSAGRYQANPANAVFQFFHNEEVRMGSQKAVARDLLRQHTLLLGCGSQMSPYSTVIRPQDRPAVLCTP